MNNELNKSDDFIYVPAMSLCKQFKKDIKDYLFGKFNINCIRIIPEKNLYRVKGDGSSYKLKCLLGSDELSIHLYLSGFSDKTPNQYSFSLCDMRFVNRSGIEAAKFILGNNHVQDVINNIEKLFSNEYDVKFKSNYYKNIILSGTFIKDNKIFKDVDFNKNLYYDIGIYCFEKEKELDILAGISVIEENGESYISYNPNDPFNFKSEYSNNTFGFSEPKKFSGTVKEKFKSDLLQEYMFHFDKVSEKEFNKFISN